ncbi:MAG: cytochrome c [Bacteroidota bacterium]
MRVLVACILLLFCLLALGDHFFQARQPKPIEVQPAVAQASRYAQGLSLYKAHCQTCHGKHGDGNGSFSGLTAQTPRVDFTAPAFKRTGVELKRVIKLGGSALGKDALMPAWKTLLSDQEIDQLAYFIITVNREGGIRRKAKTLADGR